MTFNPNNPNRPGVVNKFQLPNNNPMAMVGTGVVNKFTKILQNNSRPFIQTLNQPVVFTTPGTYTFTVPGTQTQPLNFLLVGGSGGGGGAAAGASTGGGAGGGGGILSGSIRFSPGSSVSVTIGAGGAGGSGGNTSGSSGEASLLLFQNMEFYANFGSGGQGGGSGFGGPGGSLGFPANPTPGLVASVNGSNGSPGTSTSTPNGAVYGTGWLLVNPDGTGTAVAVGSNPFVQWINGVAYGNAGGYGATVPADGDQSGERGMNGFAIFYVNG